MGSMLDAIDAGDASLGVVGLGYVGLPLSVAFQQAGLDVVGYDVDAERVDALREGESYVEDVSGDALDAALANGFTPTTDADALGDCAVLAFAVPTGVNPDGTPDVSAVEAAVETATAQRAPGEETLFVVASTVYPGTVGDVVRPAIERGGLDSDDALVAVVPERLNPGSAFELSDIPVVVGSDTERGVAVASALFDEVAKTVHPVSSTQVAAASKLLENTYRLVNISLVNELAAVADDFDVDIWEAIEAASTKPFGFQAFYPGVGAGGHCIPVDPKFLSWRARQEDDRLAMVETAAEVNDRMPSRVAARTRDALRADDIAPNEASVLVVGLTYKPNVTDYRNSPAVAACNRLADTCGTVAAYDPVAADAPVDDGVDVLTTRPAYGDYDLVAVFVAHDVLDTDAIVAESSRVFDSTNSLDASAKTVLTFADGTLPSYRRSAPTASDKTS
ncbi:nucleotide sugar dehydrogenase [Halorubellus litoreus]|uniref:UDP-N-acetyl-D-mannosamine dehydrogenase n=1 Tax=Halorubellus litoreus TaxID=755308 RepID=A0ABD5VEQ9_9EURY